ncbi:MAG TPA: trypsin-like peptidase domain-containing protein [Nitrospira sp.]|nr:trypsin-like peptidase domain-containing protein [Nitrospira sp.]
MSLVRERSCLVRVVLASTLVMLAYVPPPASAETAAQADTIERAKKATVGVLEDTQDPRTPDKPGKIKIRGTGFHFRDGYIVTARHAVEKNSPTGHIVPKVIHILTTDLHELVAQIVGESAYLDIVVYRLNHKDRPVLDVATSFATDAPAVGSEVFTVGYPMGWGPTMAFGRIGNANTFLQTVETRLVQADLSACSGNSGGPLYNHAGEVVGIMHAVIQTDKDETHVYCSQMAFAIPGTLASRIVAAAIEGKPLAFSKLGIHMTAVKEGTKWRMAVQDVSEPAKAAGIQKHDILLAIEDTEILDAAHLKNYLIERTVPGQRVSVKVRRAEADLTFTVTLAGG